MNTRNILALLLLVLLSVSSACGQSGPENIIPDPTEDLPPTTLSRPITSTPTEYIPPAITPSRTKYVPPTVMPGITSTPTDYVPPAPPPTQEVQNQRSAIDEKYVSLGGEGSFLGQSVTNEESTPDGYGRFRHFEGGSIYWSPNTGAWEVHGRIRDKWAEFGWETSFLGYPVTDESVTPDGIGRFNHFVGGSIYWSPNTDAWEIHGVIRDRWAELGWENSCLGYPISDEEPGSGAWERQNRFEYGMIQWSPDLGAVETCY